MSHRPFVQFNAPPVWTTLEFVLHTDGRAEESVPGASQCPRHWVYYERGALMADSGLTDFRTWSKECFGDHSPWEDVGSPALMTLAETELEHTLSNTLMRSGAKPRMRSLVEGEDLVVHGHPGAELFLLLDGVLEVLVDGGPVAQIGPVAVGGERALLEGGNRTSTLRAVTPVRVAIAAADEIDGKALLKLSAGHRREGRRPQQSAT